MGQIPGRWHRSGRLSKDVDSVIDLDFFFFFTWASCGKTKCTSVPASSIAQKRLRHVPLSDGRLINFN